MPELSEKYFRFTEADSRKNILPEDLKQKNEIYPESVSVIILYISIIIIDIYEKLGFSFQN